MQVVADVAAVRLHGLFKGGMEVDIVAEHNATVLAALAEVGDFSYCRNTDVA